MKESNFLHAGVNSVLNQSANVFSLNTALTLRVKY